MWDYVTSFEFNSQLAIFIYWIPSALCITAYACLFVSMYRKDLIRSRDDYYKPTLTLGRIIFLSVFSFVPVVNLFLLVFDVSAGIFTFLSKCLDIPLVPKRK